MDKKAFDWSLPRLWVCLVCFKTLWTKDSEPRCPRCGFKEN